MIRHDLHLSPWIRTSLAYTGRTNYLASGLSYFSLIQKLYFFILFCLLSNPVFAVDTANLTVGKLMAKAFEIEGLALHLSNLSHGKPQFSFSATKMALPKPFADLSLAHIRCTEFSWNKDQLHCQKGTASVTSKYWQSPSTEFSFHLSRKKNTFKLTDTRIAGSRLSLVAELKDKNWQCDIDAKNISHDLLNKLLLGKTTKVQQNQSNQAGLTLKGKVSGRLNKVEAFDLIAEVKGLTDQTQDGKIATEKLGMQIHLMGKMNKDILFWRNESKLLAGAVYVDPVYLEVKQQPITLLAHGVWNNKSKIADVQSFTFNHPETGRLSGNANGFYRDKVIINKAKLVLQSDTLPALLTTYGNPFFTESPFADVNAVGNLNVKISIDQQQINEIAINFAQLNYKDEARKLTVKEGFGSLNWSTDPLQSKVSELAWHQLVFKGVPLDSVRLKFNSHGNNFKLADKIRIPFFNGSIAIDKFSWLNKPQDEPDVSFAGSLDNVSLERLTKAIGWTPLLGNLSGHIPGVDYQNKTLSLDGELLIKVFDGTVKVNHLTSSGLFTGFPKVSGDIVVDNLDLDQLTRKFEFGNITGRLSGFINKLVLENWHPVTFFAWLGTPDNDESRHRISQKAVKNIASIGGGAATDLLSRSFLGFFETFGYDKMGVGCYLHNGVCQMMGLAAAGQGYYLIKGGGLPRIDVLGYNPQVNWDVLVERLGRVASPESVIVK